MRRIAPPERIPESKSAARRMNIQTYFGFFAESVMMAVATSLTDLTGQPVNLGEVQISTTNALKLRWGDVETVLLPVLAAKAEINTVFALTEADVTSLTKLADGRIPFHKMLEQVISTATEPFNFITKRRSRLTGVDISRNVVGFTAHHLEGEVNYTQAMGIFTIHRKPGFAVRFLVTARGRDLIEDRATQKSTQRALYSINEGAYLCRPQWKPPPPPPGMEEGRMLSDTMTGGWLQTFFGRNDGLMANRLFQRPVGLQCIPVGVEAISELAEKEGPPTVVRLVLNDEKALEMFVVLPPSTAGLLLKLSRSGSEGFLGNLFRALFGDSGTLWEAFSGSPMEWKSQGVGRIPVDSMDAVTKRLEGGGMVARQVARTDEGQLEWLLALPPHTWHWLMRMTARGMAHPSEGLPNRQAIFRATGWGQGRLPWPRMVGFFSDRDLQDLVRALHQGRVGEPVFAAVAEALDGEFRERWLEALPVMLRERTQRYRLAQGESGRRQLELTRALITLNRSRKLPEGRLTLWTSLYTEYFFTHGQYLIDQLLPLRHLVYGMDRSSLSRLLFDARGDQLAHVLAWAEFPVLDQVRRAISPGYAIRLFEDIADLRTGLTAYGAQSAQLSLYRQAFTGLTQGRYMLRATPARRLRELIRLLDEED